MFAPSGPNNPLPHNRMPVRKSSKPKLLTWNLSFANLYQVSMQGRSAEQASQKLHAVAHEWVRARFPSISQRSAAEEQALFSTGVGAVPQQHRFDGVTITSTPFAGDPALALAEVPRYAWHLELIHRDEEAVGRTWKIDLGCKSVEDSRNTSALLSMQASYRDEILLPAPLMTVPSIRFASSQLGDTGQIRSGQVPLSPQPVMVNSTESLELLVAALQDDTRSHPLVLLSGGRVSETTFSYLVEPTNLAGALYGIAPVFVEGAVRVGGVDGLIDLLDREYKIDRDLLAWGGAVRVYQPGDVRGKAPLLHWYFSRRPGQSEGEVGGLIIDRCCQLASADLQYAPSRPVVSSKDIEGFSSREQVTRLLRAVSAAQDKSVSSEQMAQLRATLQAKEHELQEARKEQERLAHTLKERTEELALYKEQLDNLDPTLEARIAAVEADNHWLKAELHRVKAELHRAKAKLESATAQGGMADQVDTEELTSGEAIYTQVRKLFADRIVFTERGEKTLCDFEFDESNQELYKKLFAAFEALHAKLWPLRFPERSTNLERHFNESSPSIALAMTEGKQTKKDSRLSKLREDVFQGDKIEGWMHLKYGNVPGRQFRVHFDFVGEGEQGRIVVSWVGDHMENASSTKGGKRA